MESKGGPGGGVATLAAATAAARLGTRRSSAFPPLRGPKLPDFRPRGTTEAQGSDLGLRLGLERLGLRARR
jgi:hypothetical protein